MKHLSGVWMAVLCLGMGGVAPGVAAPLFRAHFEATFTEGLGDLPLTTLTGAYLFADTAPLFRDPMMREAHYPVVSWTITVGGIPFPALPSSLEVENDLPAFGAVQRDAYAAIGTLAGTYLTQFVLHAAGVELVKFGTPPVAFTDFSLPTSVNELSGFTEVAPLDHRLAFLAFENLATGGSFAASAPLSHFTITAIPEPSTWLLLATGIIALLGFNWRRRKHTRRLCWTIPFGSSPPATL
ncbi:MAG: PEP-CTERM sorting domain-containing protein, partial [Candidatus Tectimicrobiota bacterium]